MGTERRVASRSRSSSPTLWPVDCGPFHPRNHHAWTLARLLWPPSQGYLCPCGTMSWLAVRLYHRLRSKRTRFLSSLLTRVARSVRKGPPRYLLGEPCAERFSRAARISRQKRSPLTSPRLQSWVTDSRTVHAVGPQPTHRPRPTDSRRRTPTAGRPPPASPSARACRVRPRAPRRRTTRPGGRSGRPHRRNSRGCRW